MKEQTEGKAITYPKEEFILYSKDEGFKSFVMNEMAMGLGKRVMEILSSEKEVRIRLSDLTVREISPLNLIEYRQLVKWAPIVRCKDCKFYWKNMNADIGEPYFLTCLASPNENAFCSEGERKADDLS